MSEEKLNKETFDVWIDRHDKEAMEFRSLSRETARDVAEIKEEYAALRATITSQNEMVAKSFENIKLTMVTKDEFRPVRLFVYGAAGSILLAVLTAILHGVMK